MAEGKHTQDAEDAERVKAREDAERAKMEQGEEAARTDPGGADDPTQSKKAPDMRAPERARDVQPGDPGADISPREQSPGRRSLRATSVINPKTIWVIAANQDGRVALYERDQLHPEGEIFVADDGLAHEVGDTPGVRVAIREGKLQEVDAGDAREHNRDVLQQRARARGAEIQRLREAAAVNQMEMSQGGSLAAPGSTPGNVPGH